jgi:hypothetical protein
MDREEKQAVMEYCAETRQSLSDLVTESVESLVEDVVKE